MKNLALGLLTFLMSTHISVQAHAETMNLESTNLVITKLEHLLTYTQNQADQNDSTGSSSKIALKMRLADLYSDRARLEEQLQQVEKSKADRLKALGTYNSIIKSVGDQESKSRTISQMAHLYQLTDQSGKATDLYKNILKNKVDYSTEVIAQAYLDLGEIALVKMKYSDAEKDFKNALIDKSRTSYINSRLAWCAFHKDQLAKAMSIMTAILKDTAVDNTLKENASHDLATFTAQKTTIELSDVQKIVDLSPESSKDSNLTYFASELDRLGKKKAALLVYHIQDSKNHRAKDFEEHLGLAQIQYDLGHKKETADELGLFFAGWNKNGCKKEERNCDLLKSRGKKLITDWTAAEERTPTPELVRAFTGYISQFPEAEMVFWAAQTAKQAKLYKEAFDLYNQCAGITSSSGATLDKSTSKLFEGSLLGQIDAAELSQDSTLQIKAYMNYLAANPKGEKAQSVKYQLAHVSYESKDFTSAAEQFHAIAITSDGDKAVREKAADTSIEALIASKNETNLQAWSQEYSKLFITRSAEFQKVSRQAMLNRQVKVINGKADKGALAGALAEMTAVDLSHASREEKLTIYKNRLVTAERLKNISEVEKAATAILNLEPLRTEDREMALNRQEWVAEMNLHFDQAFKIAKKMKMTALTPEQRLQKLSLLAELSGNNSKSYDEQFLKISRNKTLRLVVISKFVKSAANPLKVFNQYSSELKENPELYAGLGLEIFAQTNDYRFASQLIQKKKVRMTVSGHALSRFIFLKDFDYIRAEKFHPLKAPLKKSLSANLNIMKRIQNEAKRAINYGDWTLQLVTLTELQKRNAKLGEAITHLPIPRGLSKKNHLQYIALLTQQAAPYSQTAHRMSVHIADMWDKADTKKMAAEVKNTQFSMRSLAIKQIRTVAVIAPEDRFKSLREDLNDALKEAKEKPTRDQIAKLMDAVKQEPFDEAKINELRSLEEKAGHEIFVAYLDSRLIQLKQGTKE